MSSPSGSHPPRVIIAGAGLAGLCAAYELTQNNHDAMVLEARDKPGGRVQTLREGLTDGLYAEAGAMFFPSGHPLTMQYANLLKLPLVPFDIFNTNIIYAAFGKRTRVSIPGIQTVPARWLPELRPDERELSIGGLRNKYADGQLNVLGDPTEPGWPPESLKVIDAQSMGQYMRARGASEAAVRLLSIGYYNLWGEGVDSISSLFLLRDDYLEKQHLVSMVLPGGNDQFPKAFANLLPGKIQYNSPIVRIEHGDHGVRVFFEQNGIVNSIDGDYLICTIPFSVLRSIPILPAMPPDKQEMIDTLLYTSVSRIYLQVSQPFWQLEDLSGWAITDLPMMTVTPIFNTPGTQAVIHCYITGENARRVNLMTEAERAEFALDQLEIIYPTIRQYYTGHAISKCWDLDPWSCGDYVWFRPGQMTKYMPVIMRPEGRIYFAGEHASPWPAWMQGALYSGQRCASLIHQAYSQGRAAAVSSGNAR
jgi:monoamine oxidase